MDATQKQSLNLHAIAMFFKFVLLTLGITYWAASRTKSTSDFYTAGGHQPVSVERSCDRR